MSINANEKGSTAYAIEPYFLYKKRPSCKRGNATMVRRRLLSQPARGGVTQFWELRDASCTLGSNEIH